MVDRHEDDTVETVPLRDSQVPGEPPKIDRDELLIQVFEKNTRTQSEMAEHQAAMADRMRSVDVRMGHVQDMARQLRWMVALAMLISVALGIWSKADTKVVRDLAVGAGQKLDANGDMLGEALDAIAAKNDADLAKDEHEELKQIDELLAVPEPEEKPAPGTVRYKPQAARKILRKAAAAPKPSHAVVRSKAKVMKKRKAAKAKLEVFLEKRKAEPAPESQPAEEKK